MDFSKWTGPSSEWNIFIAANPITPADSTVPILEQQAKSNAARVRSSDRQLEEAGLGPLIETRDYTAPTRDGGTVEIRTYLRRSLASTATTTGFPAYVYLHGGGFLCGSLETERFTCSSLAYDLDVCVVHVCYRHTPQVKGLVPWHDTIDGFQWVVDNAGMLNIDASALVVGGISAGGMVAACLVQHELRRSKETGEPIRVKGQVLGVPNLVHRVVYPYHLFKDNVSFRMPNSALLTMERVNLFTDLLEGEPTDPFWNPALADESELRGMPRTALLICGNDLLRDEALLYATKLKTAGVPNQVHIFDGTPHVCFIMFPQLPSSKQWEEVMRSSIRWVLEAGQEGGSDGWNVHVAPRH